MSYLVMVDGCGKSGGEGEMREYKCVPGAHAHECRG